MAHEMLLDDPGINWIWYHRVSAEGDDLTVVESYRRHKGRDEHPIAEGSILQHVNPTPAYRAQIGLGEGKIVIVQFYDGVKRYYRWHGKH